MLMSLAAWLQTLSPEFGFFRVFQYITFRAVMAALTALLIGLIAGPGVIRGLAALKIGQPIREYAMAHNINLAESYAYSDSITDLPMLETVGHPVVVNPDRELAKAAREREWPIRTFANPVSLRDRVPVPGKGRGPVMTRAPGT